VAARTYDPTLSRDAQLRLTAAEHVKQLAVGNILTSEELRAGFQFEGQRIPLVNPQRGTAGETAPSTKIACLFTVTALVRWLKSEV
jgi:hypothetical protein